MSYKPVCEIQENSWETIRVSSGDSPMKGSKALTFLLSVLLSVLVFAPHGQAQPTQNLNFGNGPPQYLDDFETKANTRFSKEYWVGDPYLKNTLQSSVAYLTANSITCKLHLSLPQTLTANLTIPVNIDLAPDPGGIINIPSGITLTINGPFEAGPYQTFAGAGSVVFGMTPAIEYPQWFGNSGNPIWNQSGNAATVTGLSVTSGKILTVLNSLTLAGTDGTTMTFPGSSKTLMAADYSNAGTPPIWNQSTTGTAAGAALWGLYASIAGPTAARTYTFPDAATTIAGLGTAQTLTATRLNPRRLPRMPYTTR